ncbi:hypothetical protein HMPREF1162_1625 [ [[Propionibacterium] namnetense SK182B-JCVI]|uniref:Uncharacterized protein n=1 Tax=[Propionibacterium] namnetense SK182B-JCVI TaxID=1051006 RepID=F9NVP7_9ACTN|nr:hypothetical protein HMPREF1162_1625 [ [[Propionibacterium] namnetense SK182B-JCVI]
MSAAAVNASDNASASAEHTCMFCAKTVAKKPRNSLAAMDSTRGVRAWKIFIRCEVHRSWDENPSAVEKLNSTGF